MRKLTKTSEHGKGYSIDAADMPDAINKLGELEDKGEELLAQVCDGCCKYPDIYFEGSELFEQRCEKCPVEKLNKILYMEVYEA